MAHSKAFPTSRIPSSPSLKSSSKNHGGFRNGTQGLHIEEREDEAVPAANNAPPTLVHRFQHDKSILTLVTNGVLVYGGTQGGEILIFSLQTYELLRIVEAHSGSVLGLYLARDDLLLFSCAGDRTVNVWNSDSLNRLASIYSLYDIGDIFCVSYSARLETVYLGAQNTSIQASRSRSSSSARCLVLTTVGGAQWYNLKDYDTRPPPDPTLHPSQRADRFFDSSALGRKSTLRLSNANRGIDVTNGRNLEIDENNIQQFAHYGYVYCMLMAHTASFGPQEEVLITGGGDGIIKIWRLKAQDNGSLQELAQLDDGRDEGDSILAIVLDGAFLYSGRVDGEINIWDLETRQLLRALKVHNEDVLTLSTRAGYLFSAAVDGEVKKLDQRYQCLKKWQAHAGRVLASTITNCSDRWVLVTGGNDNTIAVWNVDKDGALSTDTNRTTHEKLLDSLRRLISYHTISSDSRYESDCRRAASYLRSVLKQFGAQTEMLKTEDGYNPIVYGRFQAPASSKSAVRKRILFYGHYDVVAADNKQNTWLSDPFVMQGIDGYLYGRGVSDNKGPILAAIYAAAEIIPQRGLDLDIVFLVEGEEECGSRGFQQTIKQYKNLIGPVDWILLANSYWLDDTVPCLTYGLRGVIHATVEIRSDEPDLHSGVDGSTLLDEPLKDLVMLLARLSGKHGRVEIPGFYDRIRTMTASEKSLYAEISRTLLHRNPSLGSQEALNASLMERWSNGSLTIHGFRTSGSETSTIIPHVARAAVSVRLVPDQEISAIASTLVSFLHAQFETLESKNHLVVTIDHEAEPWLGDYTNRLFQTLEKAVMEVWGLQDEHPPRPSNATLSPQVATRRRASSSGKIFPATSSTLANNPVHAVSSTSPSPADLLPMSPTAFRHGHATRPSKPLYIREGGSIPAIRFLEKEFGAPAAHLPCGQASDNAHLDNERFRVLNLWNSKEIFTRVFLEVPKR